jgi:hypothetical protein
VVAAEQHNHKRKRVHALEREMSSSKIRLWIENTNGGAHAEVAEIRVYAL